MLRGEVHVGQDIGFGIVHQRCQLGDTRPQLIGHLAPLLAGCVSIVLGEGSADPGGDDATLGLAGIGHGVAHEVHAAALPCGAEYFADGCLQSVMGIGDDKLDAAQAARVRLRRNSVQNGSASLLPIVMPNTSRRPSVLTATPTITATDTI